MKTLAPIILFVYNRPWHTQQTIEALQKNDLASKSELFIYADGAKQKNDPKVQEVRSYIKTITGFKQVTITERDKNWGLADNIIDGVTAIVNQFGKIIVLEDDLVSSKHFLQYMNDALEMYQNEQNVYGVSAYSFYPNLKLPETFFLPIGSSWGWATWERAWKDFESSSNKLIAEIKVKKLEKEFDFGSYPYFNMLNEQANNKINSWAVRFYASYFLKKGLFLHPRYSLVKNNGFDKEATHTKEDSIFENKVFNVKIKVKKTPIKVAKKANKVIKNHIQNKFSNKQRKPNMIKRIIQKVVQKVVQKLILILISDDIFIQKINKRIKEQHRVSVTQQITLGNKSSLYEEAAVLNLQNDKQKISIGDNTHIRGELVVFKSGGGIKIGNNCFLGINSKIWSQENIFIGNNVLIAHNVNIHDTNSHPTNYLERREDFRQIIEEGFSKTNTNIKTAAIYIDDDVWIGFNSTILKGVKIGKGVIVAAGSFVTKDIPAWTIVSGNPAQIIKHLEK